MTKKKERIILSEREIEALLGALNIPINDREKDKGEETEMCITCRFFLENKRYKNYCYIRKEVIETQESLTESYCPFWEEN